MRALLLCLLLLPALASAGDTWTNPYLGVRHLRRTSTSPAWKIHALVVDLTVPGVRLSATTSAQRKRTTSSYSRLVGAQAAVNGDFFSFSTYATSGLAAGAGVKWADTSDGTNNGNLAFGAGSRVELYPLSQLVTFDSSWMKGVVSGRPMLVSGGAVRTYTSSFCTTRHPRTAVGLSADKTKLILAVVDGRQSTSVGMTCAELSTLMKGLGAANALNLDGGGSSTLVLGGVVANSPSDGTERVTGNHLAVFAPAKGSVGTVKGAIYQPPDLTKRIVGATVKVTGGPSQLSDAQGLYDFDLAPGNYTLTASRTGYVSASVTRTVTAGSVIWGSIGLAPVPTLVDADADGVADGKDNCPSLANPDQTDADQNGVGDLCEVSPDAGIDPGSEPGPEGEEEPLAEVADGGLQPAQGSPSEEELAQGRGCSSGAGAPLLGLAWLLLALPRRALRRS